MQLRRDSASETASVWNTTTREITELCRTWSADSCARFWAIADSSQSQRSMAISLSTAAHTFSLITTTPSNVGGLQLRARSANRPIADTQPSHPKEKSSNSNVVCLHLIASQNGLRWLATCRLDREPASICSHLE